MTEKETVKLWIKTKGVSVWPSLPFADTTDDTEADALADWFIQEMYDLDNFTRAMIKKQTLSS